MTTIKEFVDVIDRCGGSVFAVGGSVRDEFLGLAPKDLDVVVLRVPPEVIEDILAHLPVKFDTVGKSFGVIKARFSDAGEVDIALPRREVSTGLGHKDFSVECAPEIPLEEDARRRDFKINAIYKDLKTGEIVDPLFGARAFDPDSMFFRQLEVTSETAFLEDPLRILRGVQFCARFGMVFSYRTTLLIRDALAGLDSISPERVSLELEKLLVKAPKPSVGLQIMADLGVLRHVIPELVPLFTIKQPAKHHNADAFTHTIRVVDGVRPNLNMRFAALFHDLGKATTFANEDGRITFHGHEGESARIADEVIDRLKLFTLEGFDREKVIRLVKNHMFSNNDKVTKRAIRRLIRKVGGPADFHDLIQLRVADKLGGANPHTIWVHLEFLRRAMEIFNEQPAMSVRDLAISGRDLIEMGVPEGPRIGNILRALFERVEEGTPNEFPVLTCEAASLIERGE